MWCTQRRVNHWCVLTDQGDAVQGTLFHDRMKAEVVRKVKRDLVSLEETYLKEHPGADIQRV